MLKLGKLTTLVILTGTRTEVLRRDVAPRSASNGVLLWARTKLRPREVKPHAPVTQKFCSKLVLSVCTQPPKPSADVLAMCVKCQNRCRGRRRARGEIRTPRTYRLLEGTASLSLEGIY